MKRVTGEKSVAQTQTRNVMYSVTEMSSSLSQNQWSICSALKTGG